MINILIIGYDTIDESSILNEYDLSKIKFIKVRNKIVLSSNVSTYLEIPITSILYSKIIELINKKYLVVYEERNYFFNTLEEIRLFFSSLIDLSKYKESSYINPYCLIDLKNQIKMDYYLKKVNSILIHLKLTDNTKGNLLAEIKCPYCNESFLSDVGPNEVFVIKCEHCQSELQVVTKEYKIIKIKGE